MSFWGELKRRNVVRVGTAYAVAAWLLAQIASVVEEPLGLPAWFDTGIIVLLAFGFPVAVLFAWAFEVTPEGLQRARDVPAPESAVQQVTGRRLDYVLTVLLGLVVAFLVVDNYVLDGERRVASAPRAASGDASGAPDASPAVAGAVATQPEARVLPNSVAVLPFENLSPNADEAFFARGIHEEILNYLAKLKALNVIARTSVMQYAGTSKPITQIAEELNVETVMEGSVRYAGNRVRVTTQLIDARTGAHLWSEAYEREFADIFAIQADVARSVAEALEAEFSAEERRAIERPPTSSAEAYALYLQSQSLNGAGVEIVRTHALLDRALELDPEFALAWGAKASAYGAQLVNTAGALASDNAELEPLIRRYAQRALELDPQNGFAHASLANLEILLWHWTNALESAPRAFDSPQFPSVLVNWFLCWSGNFDEAIRYAERNAALNPASWVGPWSLGMVLAYAGRYEAAAEALRRSIAMEPALPVQRSWLAWTEIALGNREAALQELRVTEQLLGDDRLVLYLLDLAYGYGRLGDRENAERLFAEVQAVAASQEIGAGGWAIANLAIGDRDEALRWLGVGADKAQRHEIDAGMFSLMNLKLNVTNDPLLEEPEFVEVRKLLTGD